MARSLRQIEEEINTNIGIEPALQPLRNNSSRASVWGALKHIFALSIQVLERLFDNHREEVDARVAQGIAGTALWYSNIAKQYQHGDTLIIQNNRLGYATINTNIQIVKHASVTNRYKVESDSKRVWKYTIENGKRVQEVGIILIKIAGGDPVRTDLSNDEAIDFENYINRVKFGGTRVIVRNAKADKIKIKDDAPIFIQVDTTLWRLDEKEALSNTDRTQVVKGATFISDNMTLKSKVSSAINDYLNNTSFDSRIYKSSIIDAVQGIDGVVAVHLEKFSKDNVEFDNAAPTRELEYIRWAETFAGYGKIEEADIFLRVNEGQG